MTFPISRRRALQFASLSAAGVLSPELFAQEGSARDPIRSIERETIFRGRDGGTTWFSTRACAVPNKNGASMVFMMLAEITGSDYFGPVHSTQTTDLGKTWSEPVAVPMLGRTPREGGVQEGSCDWVPEFHAKTNTVLAMGHNVFYKGGRFYNEQPPRHTVFAVRRASGEWGPPTKLEWNDPRGKFIYTTNCSQRVTLPDGDVLVPLSFGAGSNARSVAVVRCSFDGEQLIAKQTGDELKMKVGRGFLEPSLATFDGQIYLTLRAEDGHGHVAVSDDGLKFSPPQPWTWDDGSPIAMSTTQQRWLPHRGGLSLVYTRKDASNEKVMRWRAPLFVANVDLKTRRLIRETERIALPLTGDAVKDPNGVGHLGNFHTTAVNDQESWITVGEFALKNWRGDTLLARVNWK
ncbi:hypothetical protein ETAA8_69330 [Anatilimnocola aggregata]|uniref:Sialidase n=1 Tax=Anatilimnocola aggregata TaxID=2528021 RepID=A0A517YNH0_9BACT|nr:sialidase family protein [Anatilimnocola aggregata]QDU31773.1 hypothetical protein ETAA8_69330 [Anatilimnocola aggregata]